MNDHATSNHAATPQQTADGADSAIAVHVEGLTDGYDRTTVLDDIDLRVDSGHFFALLGRNGAGKSTLVQSLLGFRRPLEGKLRVLGLDPWRHRRQLMREVALVPETPNVPPHMSVRSAARFVAAFLGQGRFDRVAFEELLEEDEISARARFGGLSRGQKNSVGLALALSSQPQLMVLDDPTLGLDAVARRRTYRRLIDHVAEHGTTVFLTTHDLAAVDGLATHVGFLQRGALPVVGAVDELKQRFQLVEVAEGADTDRLPGRIVRLDDGVLGGRALLELGDQAVRRSAFALETPTIEDLFVALLETENADRDPLPATAA